MKTINVSIFPSGKISTGSLLLVLLILLFAPGNAASQSGRDTLTQSMNKFAFDFYGHVNTSGENLMFSPLGIYSALTMTYEGAEGKTKSEMASLFNFPEDELLRTQMNKMTKELTFNSDSLSLQIANSLWVQKDFAFDQNYLKTLETAYKAHAEYVDFIQPAERKKSVEQINDWVEKNTNDKITNMLNPIHIQDNTRLILLNAIYFYSQWDKAFDKTQTREMPFYKGDDALKASFMQRKDRYLYYEDHLVQAVHIPYAGKRFSMLILLPSKKNGIDQLNKEMSLDYLDKIIQNSMYEQTKLFVPVFSFDYSKELKKTFQKMGMETAFTNKANFSSMTGQRDLKIDKVLHKTFIEVNEAGTEAAASTAVIMVEKSSAIREDVKIFRADHPFVFMIRDNKTGLIPFFGKVSDPVSN